MHVLNFLSNSDFDIQIVQSFEYYKKKFYTLRLICI